MSSSQALEERAPWTIKGVSVETRRLAVARAAKRGQTMGQWLDAAVRNQSALEDGDLVITPDSRQEPRHGSQKAVEPMTALAHVLEAAHHAQQASGVPLPKAIARHAYALIGANLRAARGLPPLKRAPSSRTIEAGLPLQDGKFARADTLATADSNNNGDPST